MIDIHINADEVQVGDNVWEHNIVRTITTPVGGVRIFNEGAVDEWKANAGDTVMVTNRPTLRMKDWKDTDRAHRAEVLRGIGKYQMQPLTPYQSAWLRELALEIDNS